MRTPEDKGRLWAEATAVHPDDLHQAVAHYVASLDDDDTVLDLRDGSQLVNDDCRVNDH